MRWAHIENPVTRLTLCTVVVIAVTYVFHVLPTSDRPLTGVLSLLFVVVTVAAMWGFRYAVFVSCVSAIGFASLLPSVGHFAINDARDAFALIAFLAIGTIAGHLSDRTRREAQRARKAEEAARRSVSELREVIETIPAMAWTALPDGSNTFVNRRWAEYTGLSVADSAGSGWHRVIHPDDFERYSGKWRASVTTGEPFEDEVRFRRAADHEFRWFLSRAVALRNEHGTILRWFGIVTDIEDHKRTEQAALQRQVTLREQANLLDLTHDTIFVRDAHDVITYWNAGAEELYGWKREQALGRVTHELLQTIFPEPLDQITAKLLRTGHWEGELVHTKRDRSRVTVASRWSLKRDETGRPVGTLETNNDITYRKSAEQERERLRQLQADLARVNRVTTMGELTASLAHEVNQPIAAAITDANTCLRWLTRAEPDANEARLAAERSVKAATRAADIISRIRWLFKKSGPEHELVNVNALITDIIALVASEALRHGVSLHTQLAPQLQPVKGDRVQLQQVLLNLMMNGIEAMKDGDVPREITVTSRRGDRAELLVSVADTGVGLPPSVDEIFNAFFTTKPDGTGMGLAISRSIVEAHGGRLWATTNAGRGATFSFTLPSAGAADV